MLEGIEIHELCQYALYSGPELILHINVFQVITKLLICNEFCEAESFLEERISIELVKRALG